MKATVNNIQRAALVITLTVLLCCCQRPWHIEQDSSAYLIVDFHDADRNVLSVPVEIAADSFLTAYELLKASRLKYKLHPKYASPPAILLERIEGLPTSLSKDLFWAVFLKTRDNAFWEYQEVGISELKVFSGMVVGFSLTRWKSSDSVLTPLDLPRHDLLNEESTNVPQAVHVRHEDLHQTDAEQSKAINRSREVVGCGWGSPSAPVKLLPQFSSKTIEEAVRLTIKDPNKLSHLFAHKHKLGPLVNKLGGQKNTVRAVLNAANGKLPSSGVFRNVSVQVHGQTVIIRGNVINGIPRLGTMYIP